MVSPCFFGGPEALKKFRRPVPRAQGGGFLKIDRRASQHSHMRKPATNHREPGTTPASRKSVTPAKKAVPAKKATAGKGSPTPKAKVAKDTKVHKPKAAPPAQRVKWTVAASVERTTQPATQTAALQHSGAVQQQEPQDHASQLLTMKEERFVAHYFEHLSASAAYQSIHPGVLNSTARTEGAKTLAKPHIQAALAELRIEAQARTGITIDNLVNRLGDMALADASEIVSWRVGCCRNCHGEHHLYQRTDAEFAKDKADFDAGMVRVPRRKKGQTEAEHQAAVRKTQEWHHEGGPGFDARRPPHPDCPHCIGEGTGRVVIADSRNLSPRAKALFAGVEMTEKGYKARMHSQLDAIEKLMRHLGGYEKDNKQKGGDLADWLSQMNRSAALPVVPESDANDEMGGSIA